MTQRRSVFRAVIGAVAASAAMTGVAVGEEWSESAPLETGRAYLGAAVLGEDIYVVGGGGILGPRNDVDAYDTIANHWRPMPPLPAALERFAISAAGNRLILSGGVASDGEPSREAWSLDPSLSSEWRPLPSLPHARFEHAMVWRDGVTYLLGGDGKNARDVLALRDGANKWRRVSKAPNVRRYAMAVAMEGDIYLLGGEGKDGDPLARVDVYNLESEDWRRVADLPEPRSGIATGAVNGRLHVAGGRTGSPAKTLARHDIFDPATGEWIIAPDMPTARFATASAVVGDKWYVIGGGAGGGVFTAFTASDAVEVFAP